MEFLAVLVFLLGSSGNSPPKLPFSEKAACPFECCQYGQWTASSTKQVLSEQRKTASVAFTIRPGETVQAVTGVVVTRKFGLVRILKTTKFLVNVMKTRDQSELTIPPAETLYTPT